MSGIRYRCIEVAISPLDPAGGATGPLTGESGVVGEVCIRAPHMRDGYDKLWATDQAASQPDGWHRSGDVGHLDEAGRLWIEGRMGDIVTTPNGPVTPVGIEHAVSTLSDVSDAAAVGVGPPGTQQLVVVVVPAGHIRHPDLADEALADRVRGRAGGEVAAVLTAPSLPVDKRHNSKIDRAQDRPVGSRVSWREAGWARYESPRDRSDQPAGPGRGDPSARTRGRGHRLPAETQRSRCFRAPR